MFKQKLKKIIKKMLGLNKPNPVPNLDGDRNIEWTWVFKYLPHNKKVMDIGCCYSIVSATSCRFGNETTGVDLNNEINFVLDNFKFVKGNVVNLNFSEKFDCVVLASTVEHIGLFGRYNSVDDVDGDLKTMKNIKGWLSEGGELIVTIPVGVDGVFLPFHRVYGPDRLSKLFEGFSILDSEFWIKSDKINWIKTTKERALKEQGSPVYYALGLFRLKLNK